jgi:hypothetical protein
MLHTGKAFCPEGYPIAKRKTNFQTTLKSQIMMTNNGCTPTPQTGLEATALYFTKAPGEDYYKVYARYAGNPSWVPIHLARETNPDLQQVRDADRNISLNSGSYDDAHFYLRSADGNNMTTAFFTNAEGGGIQSGNAAGLSPLNLQPEGGTLTYGGEEVATKDWINEQKEPELIPMGANLNNYTTTGSYLQRSDMYAAEGIHYPEWRAGMLEVQNGNDGEMIFQRYTTWGDGGTHLWKRMAYMGTWYAWERLQESGESVIFGHNTAGNMFNGYPGNSVLYNNSWSGTPDSGEGLSWNAALNNTGGIYSAQMYIGVGAGPGAALDNFYYRANQQGGSGWPTPWFRVASREWSNTSLLQNQNSAAQTADYWINGTGRAAKLGVNTAPASSAQFHVDGKTFLNGGLDVGDTAYYNNDVALSVKSNRAYLFNMYDASAVPKLTLLQNGNLGVGTVSPAEKLQVNGSIRQSGTTSSMLKADANGKIVAAVAGTDYQAATVASGLYTPTVSVLKGSVSSVTGKCLFTRNGDLVTVSGGLQVTLGASSPVAAGFELSLPIASTLNMAEDCSGLGSGSSQAVSGIGIEPAVTNDKAAVNFERTAATGVFKVNIFFTYKIN